MSIMDYFPAHLPSPRSEQIKVLEAIEDSWASASVFQIVAPTALGKTAISMTLANWIAAMDKTANILVPTNILLGQLKDDYPDVAVLKRKDYYATQDSYKAAKEDVRAASVRAMNYHIYMYNKMYGYAMICDEGHKLVDILADMQKVRIWQHEFNYPADIKTVRDVLMWMESQHIHESPKLQKAYRGILSMQDHAIVEHNIDLYRHKKAAVLDVVPTTTQAMPPILWPSRIVRKIILMSATINRKDVVEMGLGTRQITTIEAGSPIPPMNRQVRYAPVGRMSYQYMQTAAAAIAEKVKDLLVKNPHKGLIHIPYSAAEELRKHLSDRRLLWHTHDNKDQVLRQFKTSSEPLVMVASGMYEGVDLPYDLARWQVIAKIPYLSLGSEKVQKKMERDPDWYDWEAIKRVLQATGRIVRHPDDYGVTYILDSNFWGLWQKDQKRDEKLFPQYFREALIL